MRIASTHKTPHKRHAHRYRLFGMRRPDGVRFTPHLHGRLGGPKVIWRPKWAWNWTWWRPRYVVAVARLRFHSLVPLTPDKEKASHV